MHWFEPSHPSHLKLTGAIPFFLYLGNKKEPREELLGILGFDEFFDDLNHLIEISDREEFVTAVVVI